MRVNERVTIRVYCGYFKFTCIENVVMKLNLSKFVNKNIKSFSFKVLPFPQKPTRRSDPVESQRSLEFTNLRIYGFAVRVAQDYVDDVM